MGFHGFQNGFPRIKDGLPRNQKWVSTLNQVPVLEQLRVKATERIRVFLLTKISSLGRPKTNFQIIQQSVTLNPKP